MEWIKNSKVLHPSDTIIAFYKSWNDGLLLYLLYGLSFIPITLVLIATVLSGNVVAWISVEEKEVTGTRLACNFLCHKYSLGFTLAQIPGHISRDDIRGLCCRLRPMSFTWIHTLIFINTLTSSLTQGTYMSDHKCHGRSGSVSILCFSDFKKSSSWDYAQGNHYSDL